MFNSGTIKPKTIISINQATNRDIRKTIDKMISTANKQMNKAAAQFRGKDEKETAENIWTFLKHRIRYQADGQEQIVKAPSALVRTKTGDCKSYAVFTSAVLTNLNIQHKLVYTSYSDNPTPEHVYVITEKGFIIDAVWHSFNSEKKPVFKYTQKMNVKGITGIAGSTGKFAAGTSSAMLGGIGAVERKSALRAVNMVRMTLSRNSFLALLRLNALGLASAINYAWAKSASTYKGAGDSPAKRDTLNTWYNLGGNIDAFNAAIKAGEQKKAVGNKFILLLEQKNIPGARKYGALLKETIDHYVNSRKIDIREPKKVRGIGLTGAEIGAAITSATPIILALIPIIAALAGREPSAGEFNEISNQYGDGTRLEPGTPTQAGGIAPLLIAGGLAAALFLTGKKTK